MELLFTTAHAVWHVQHVRDTEMALRAEDYKHSYLLARLEVEEALIPDEQILALEMEVTALCV